MDTGKIQTKYVKNVLTNVKLVLLMLITVLNVMVSELQSKTAHAQQDITK